MVRLIWNIDSDIYSGINKINKYFFYREGLRVILENINLFVVVLFK